MADYALKVHNRYVMRRSDQAQTTKDSFPREATPDQKRAAELLMDAAITYMKAYGNVPTIRVKEINYAETPRSGWWD